MTDIALPAELADQVGADIGLLGAAAPLSLKHLWGYINGGRATLTPGAAPRFALDETRAAQWLARSMTAHDGLNGSPFPDRPGFPPGGYLTGDCGHAVARSEWAAGFTVCERCPGASEWADVPMAEIGNDYCAALDDDPCNDTSELVNTALAAGIIGDSVVDPQHQDPSLIWTFESDGDGDGYRWHLYLDAASGLVLATPLEAMRHMGGGSDLDGLDSAMEVLRDAEREGNAMLTRLAAQAALPVAGTSAD
jgi:hypothetical protein